ncbi:phosphoribosylglycinamide formyltransferase [Fretibacter rubidus]|uniref:phosphoribosylglycinamide formyltransferase n=1 Tax=Fretibacter rubidus TaxID=570162 RepID=UPI00352B17E0
MAKPNERVKTAVLISGRGSNMVALVTAAQDPNYPADIALVISNRPKAKGLGRAQELGVTAISIDHKAYATREAFEAELDKALSDAKIELICCAGFMRVLTPWFINRWEGRIINIHPSLLPKYKGLNTHARALDAGDREHGCSVHWVSAELDGGAVIKQMSIPIDHRDTAESLADRLLPLELALYPKALAQVARDIKN